MRRRTFPLLAAVLGPTAPPIVRSAPNAPLVILTTSLHAQHRLIPVTSPSANDPPLRLRNDTQPFTEPPVTQVENPVHRNIFESHEYFHST